MHKHIIIDYRTAKTNRKRKELEGKTAHLERIANITNNKFSIVTPDAGIVWNLFKILREYNQNLQELSKMTLPKLK